MRPPTDLDRIIALPRHSPEPKDMTPYVIARPGAMFRGRPARLLPVQNRIIVEGLACNGGIAFAGVGSGKTLSYLMLMLLLAEQHGIPFHKMLLLIPASVRADFHKQFVEYQQAFRLPKGVQIKTYSELSEPSSTAYLEALKPEVIVCDEADALKSFSAARTARFLRYLKANSIWRGGTTRLYILSGTLISKSIMDWSHLAKYALGPNSPAPLEYGSLQLFSEAIDEEEAPGDALRPLMDAFDAEDARTAFRKRLLCCAGVVVTQTASVDIPVICQLRDVYVPPDVVHALRVLEGWWELPSGELLGSALEVHAKSIELSMGFYHEFVWPNGPDLDWLSARQAWHRALRGCLPGAPAGYDSPKLVADACEREIVLGQRDSLLTAEARIAYSDWRRERVKEPPPTRTVWLNRFLIWDTLQWLRDQPPTLIWSESPDMSNELSRYCPDVRNIGVGPEADAWLASGPVAEHVVVSANSHYRGKNLQQWSNNLILVPPSGGQIMEQLIGRTARQGQTADAIRVYINQHTGVARSAWESCRRDARLAEEACAVSQILNHAEIRQPDPLNPLPADYPAEAMVPPGYRRSE